MPQHFAHVKIMIMRLTLNHRKLLINQFTLAILIIQVSRLSRRMKNLRKSFFFTFWEISGPYWREIWRASHDNEAVTEFRYVGHSFFVIQLLTCSEKDAIKFALSMEIIIVSRTHGVRPDTRPDPVENILMIEERHAEPRDRLCRHHPLGDIMREEEGVEYDRIPDLESQDYSEGCKHEPACVKGAEA